MKRKGSGKSFDKRILFLILPVFLILSFIICLSFGSVMITPKDIVKAIFVSGYGSPTVTIIRSIRLPRIIAGLFAGVGLSVSGVLLQGVMNNALASPNTIGVGSGAGFFAMIAMVAFPTKIWTFPVFAFAGALAATLLIYLIAYFSDASRITIILAGITVSSFLSAGINLLKTLNTDLAININSFLIGSLSGVSFSRIRLPMIMIAAGVIASMFLARPLGLLGLGEDVARSLGLRVNITRFVILLISSILAGSVVSYAGLIGFVGLIVPHICRRLFGSEPGVLIPCSALAGAGFVIICDLMSRVIFIPYELPTGIIMSFLGGPFFVYLILRKKGGRRLNA